MSQTAPPADAIPVSITDPVNAQILSISEDRIAGFTPRPFAEIARRSGVGLETVLARIAAMLEAGTIRRVRQTLMTTSLAPGALVAWQVPADKLHGAFDALFEGDPFSGHVVLRSTDADTPGSGYRLWTTLKVPVGFSMLRHCDHMAAKIGARRYKLLPAKKLFALGVGHVRRRSIAVGARSEEPGRVLSTKLVELDPRQWRVVEALKRPLSPGEIVADPWAARAAEAGVSLQRFCAVVRELDEKGVIGRFSTFLEHVKKLRDGSTVTRYNALFHWAVPEGKQMAAGLELGRHHCMTHAYWREAGAEFNHVNIMGVAHGTDKGRVLANKAAIDQHLQEQGIEVGYTAVFWGGRSEIKPSEIAPAAYQRWCRREGLDPAAMREDDAPDPG